MRRVTSQVPDGRTRAPRRGTAAVEFAVAAPVLLLIAFGCTDLGRAIGSYVAVSNAARVGAEYGATHAYTSYTYASWENQVTLQAQQEMQGSPTFNSNQLSVTVSTVPETGNLYLVTVTATYPF
ncbi:MAG TPA: TadE/TadG family type IV pilus assembly protein, partial [Planctomycetaceae bacterium]|nr:TadE/TadG family type IV pilus assembly protein [Planctomycetaceae bacterium]